LSKKSSSRAEHSCSRTPPMTSTRCSARRSRGRSHTDPQAPALGSQAPKTTRSTRASIAAPAHMAHGSRVTASVHPSNRHDPVCRPASRSATTSAWPVGSPSASRTFHPVPMTSPSAESTTAPIGTSPDPAVADAAARA